MLWQKVKQVYNDGVQGHFDSLYNYFDFAVLTVYITSFTLRFLTLIKVRIYRLVQIGLHCSHNKNVK